VASLDEASSRCGPSVGLVVLDISSVGGQKAEAFEWFTRHSRQVGTVAVFDELDAWMVSILRDGDLRGLIPLRSSLIDVWHALRCVLQGGIHWPDPRELGKLAPTSGTKQGSPRAAREWAPPVALTSRQNDVLALLLRGLSNKQICKELDLALGTVKAHVSAIFRSLQVDSRAQAIVEIRRQSSGHER